MRRYVFNRLLSTVPVVMGVVTIVFLFLHLIPGDPVDLILGDSAIPAQRTELKRKLHLDEPVWKQYARYVTGVAHFDLGRSIQTGEPVAGRILTRFRFTLALALAALCIALAMPRRANTARGSFCLPFGVALRL